MKCYVQTMEVKMVNMNFKISFQTNPYTPEQNGNSETLNRSLEESAGVYCSL